MTMLRYCSTPGCQATATALLEGDYVFDLWRTNSGQKTCLCSGRFFVVDTARN